LISKVSDPKHKAQFKNTIKKFSTSEFNGVSTILPALFNQKLKTRTESTETLPLKNLKKQSGVERKSSIAEGDENQVPNSLNIVSGLD
jgi:hypothetical protein